jgi:predicted ArsR family transcriptional regulator
VLASQGYDPRVEGDEVVLTNCPFDSLAKQHTALVCGLNESFVGGVVDGLGCAGLVARLDPEEGLCCVKVGGEPGPSRT